MKRSKNKNSHGLCSNILFMFREQWGFEKKAFIYPVAFIVFDLAAALIVIWMPKTVLDLIIQSVTSIYFITSVCVMTTILMIFRYFSHYAQQAVYKSTVRILNQYFYIKKDWKILDMDYAMSSSPEGRIKIEKGHKSTNRNIFVNMASFYPNFTDLVKNIAGLGTFSAILLTLHPGVVFVLVVSYIADAYISFRVRNWEHTVKDARAQVENKLYYILDEIRGAAYAKEIRAYNMHKWLEKSFDDFADEKVSLEKQVQKKYFNQGMFEVFLYLVRNGGGYIFLIWRMLTTDMTIGDFVFYFGTITGFVQWLDRIIICYKNITNANFLIDDFRDLIDTKDISNREAGHKLPEYGKSVEIVLKDVCFKYEGSEHMILDHINLHICRGEKLAIVGANGAGKTTLIKLICGLLQPVSGSIFMNGVNIQEFNRDEYYSLVTAVFQGASLLPMSIAQNITLCSEEESDMEKLNKVICMAGLDEKIAKLPLGYNTNLLPSITENGIDLSGGETQKLMLARALYKDAPLLILDEPTAALDPIAENMMYQKYHELTENKTSIFISHRLSSTRFCNRIIYLENGKICEEGSHEELMTKNGKYREVFDIQSHYYKASSEESVI